MGSIFYRIYSGLLFSLLVTLACSYFGFQYYNEHRLQQYLYQTTSPTFQLISEGLGRHRFSTRKDWVKAIESTAGLALSIQHYTEYELVAREQAQLLNGKVVITSHLDDRSATVLIPVPDDDEVFFSTKLQIVSENFARLTALMILSELARQNPEADGLAELRQKFLFSIDRISSENTTLNRSQRRRLARGDFVVVLNDVTATQPHLSVFSKYDKTGQVLVIGPIPLFSWFPGSTVFAVGSLAALLLAVCAYVLIRPLEHRLLVLAQEIELMGEGLEHKISIKNNDAISQVAIKLNSMTDQIRALILEQRELSQAVSHELRTPIARLKFRLESLLTKYEIPDNDASAMGVKRDLNELNNLVDEVLTFYRLERRPESDDQDISIDLLCHKLIDDLQSFFEEQHLQAHQTNLAIEHEFCTPRQEDMKLVGSEHLLKRLMQNLFTNAARHAATKVRIETQSVQGVWSLCVSDDGAGIPVEDRGRIFEPFIRLDSSRNRASGGHGLGLAIARKIAQSHSGEITVEDSELGGAKFRLTLPLQQ